MRAIRLKLALVLALSAALLQPAAAAPLKIRIGWIVAPASMVPLLFLKPGGAKHLGKSYTFEPLHFSSSTLQITAIAQGEIDIAGFGYTSFPLAIQNAGLNDLRIADEIQTAPGYYSTPIPAWDAGINKIEDMKARWRPPTARQQRRYRHAHGAAAAGSVKRDYTMIEAPSPPTRRCSRAGRPGRGRAAVLLRSGAERFAQPLFTTSRRSVPSPCRSGRRARALPTRTALRGSICWKTTAPRCAVLVSQPKRSRSAGLLGGRQRRSTMAARKRLSAISTASPT
jgi:NitT/TauT family transport system substrate-binding protein